jgi:hypothetical protein
MLGGVLGLLTLLSAFLLPFSNIAQGNGGGADSLLTIFKIFVIGVSNFQVVGLTQLTELAYAYMFVFVLILISGIIGAYPRWSAAFGIIGMAVATISPFFIFTTYSFSASNFGLGFPAIWATTAVTIYAAYWSNKERAKAMPPKAPAPTPAPSPTAVPPQ